MGGCLLMAPFSSPLVELDLVFLQITTKCPVCVLEHALKQPTLEAQPLRAQS